MKGQMQVISISRGVSLYSAVLLSQRLWRALLASSVFGIFCTGMVLVRRV